jgi:AcrR family transcriptional regulator
MTARRGEQVKEGKADGSVPRKRAGQSTEEKILSTAEKLFARYGFDAVRTKQLAVDAGVTIGAIYHHFASKEALYEAATRRVFSRRSIPPKKLFESDESPERRLTQLVSWFVSSIISDKNFGLLLQRELLNPRAHTPSLVDIEVFQDALELCKDLLRQLLPDSDIDEALASMLALSFGFANLKGIYLIVPGIRKTLSTPDEIADHATRLLLHGLKS